MKTVPTLPIELKANIESRKRNFNLSSRLAVVMSIKKRLFFPSSKWEKRRPWWEYVGQWVHVIGLKACSAVRRVYKHRFPSDSLLTFSHQRCRGKALQLSRQSNWRWFMIDLKMFSATAKAADRVNWQRLAIKSTKYVVNMIYVAGEKRTPFIKWETLLGSRIFRLSQWDWFLRHVQFRFTVTGTGWGLGRC